MRILYFGDIVGKIARTAIVNELPRLKKKYQPDFVFANAENLAHGVGVTGNTIAEMIEAGIDYMTSGNHIFDNHQGEAFIKDNPEVPVLRPANYSKKTPGSGYAILNQKVLLINLLGQVFIEGEQASPFKTMDEILSDKENKNVPIKIVDMHAEATSEKQALWHYLDGKVSAVIGTHTHVPTANPRVSKSGTALCEDVGMVGGADSILGAGINKILKRFLLDEKTDLDPPAQGKTFINAVLLEIDEKTGHTLSIKRVDHEVMV